MGTALHLRNRIQPGNRLEIIDPQLRDGASVEVFVVDEDTQEDERRSAWEIIRDLPGARLFKTAEEVDRYIEEERNSWDS